MQQEQNMRRCLFVLLAIASGCGPAPIVTSPLIIARPYDSHIPASYDPSQATPLVLLLHGYSATPFVEDVVIAVDVAGRRIAIRDDFL